MGKARAVIAGSVEVVEHDAPNFQHPLALVIVFDNAEAIRAALRDGRCEFTFGDEDTQQEARR